MVNEKSSSKATRQRTPKYRDDGLGWQATRDAQLHGLRQSGAIRSPGTMSYARLWPAILTTMRSPEAPLIPETYRTVSKLSWLGENWARKSRPGTKLRSARRRCQFFQLRRHALNKRGFIINRFGDLRNLFSGDLVVFQLDTFTNA